jgi:hypothetical protein
MSNDTKDCKECNLTKAESDFPKGKSVCKACISAKTKETKAKKEEVEEPKETKKKSSPAKEEKKEEPKKKVSADQKIAKQRAKLETDFEKMMNEISPGKESYAITTAFIGKLINFTDKINNLE